MNISDLSGVQIIDKIKVCIPLFSSIPGGPLWFCYSCRCEAEAYIIKEATESRLRVFSSHHLSEKDRADRLQKMVVDLQQRLSEKKPNHEAVCVHDMVPVNSIKEQRVRFDEILHQEKTRAAKLVESAGRKIVYRNRVIKKLRSEIEELKRGKHGR